MGIPAWALLFSALPAPSSINPSTGTGYHVTITGYGRNGTGLNGDTGGIDYRRRVAENYLGALASLSDVDMFLYGDTSRTLNQNLYMTDLDDPRRGTASASRFDFNLFKDNALPNEGITAGGDSGGPLILDRTFSKPVVIGVLSGGTRYYAAQPSSSFGTTSFYQPLYLYWDYIVASNPYRYVSAKAGDAKWSDATHWQTELDPSYQIIQDGKLVNGVPTTAGQGRPDRAAISDSYASKPRAARSARTSPPASITRMAWRSIAIRSPPAPPPSRGRRRRLPTGCRGRATSFRTTPIR